MVQRGGASEQEKVTWRLGGVPAIAVQAARCRLRGLEMEEYPGNV
jgi:hypothetical protein